MISFATVEESKLANDVLACLHRVVHAGKTGHYAVRRPRGLQHPAPCEHPLDHLPVFDEVVLDRCRLFVLLHLRRADDIDGEEGKVAAERIELALGLGENAQQFLVIEGLARLELLEFGVKCHGDLRLGRHLQLGSPLLGALAQRAPVHRPVDARADRADEHTNST
ncbi:hypothetical protein, partial [Methyloceanibacter sp.]|uniref:hypothetical protein n=1 Tax=Methyloceanibacter sp. TaxID=1965321 RepID=UPI00351AD2B0